MKKFSAIGQQLKQLWAQWLLSAVFTQAGSALEGSHRHLSRPLNRGGKSDNRY
ncbi:MULTISPECIES: hypothetical protein [unclassified Tatumella]|uniref:hypothetical protein n=1 Tax=unclassified Tatumella TaxID=2649542 RepID=UPI001BAE6D6F|nr:MULTISPECIES: hypothetical protein [unclassified Tatumella]MBS0876462.1 hypothetical protein [Tatumella sp. JGM82]MBS0889635.1 hypothetical protein [Tatumella sp. JGM94]MBS0900757.1 hypothetical protein [Tatumella sp. JGM100]